MGIPHHQMRRKKSTRLREPSARVISTFCAKPVMPARRRIRAAFASGADSAAHRGRTSPFARAPSAAARTPPTGRRRPSSASSPIAACPLSRSGETWRDAPRIERAIGRSKPDPSFRSPAGARLTVIRRIGHSSSADAMPLRTRSFASWQARSARPTIANAGTPDWRWASTSTLRASRPTRACVTVRASTLSV